VAILEPVLSKQPSEYPFVEMYEVFERVLEVNEPCVVIGFSFRDDRVRNVIAKRLASSKPFRLIIVAPEDLQNQHLDMHIATLATDSKVKWVKFLWGSADIIDEVRIALEDH
jgi:predicted CoA-binding protein